MMTKNRIISSYICSLRFINDNKKLADLQIKDLNDRF